MFFSAWNNATDVKMKNKKHKFRWIIWVIMRTRSWIRRTAERESRSDFGFDVRPVRERAYRRWNLSFSFEKIPLLLPRLLSLSPCRNSGLGLIRRRHLGEWTDIIGGAASGVTTRSCGGWVWWSRFVRLDFDSGRWRLLKFHHCRSCFREVEAFSVLRSPALVSGGEGVLCLTSLALGRLVSF